MKQQAKTLIDLLRYQVEQQPDQTAYIFLKDGESEEGCLTYQTLEYRARTIAAYLQATGQPGDRVLLLYQPGLEYITAFFACLYAGMIAVPTYPPHPKRPMLRLKAIVNNAQPKFYLTNQALGPKLITRFDQEPQLATLSGIFTDTLNEAQADLWQAPTITPETLAFLQYTSGSTGAPRGVKISHSNLLYNQRMIATAFGHTDETIFVGWLPLFHDMGLVGNVLQPMYMGIPCILMPPTAFLRKPIRWLQAISRYRATTSGAPNFAYDLCVQKIKPEQRTELDLRSWQVAFNGAEPVRASTLDRFAQAFEPSGFRREALYPCYGLAEATLFVSGGLAKAQPETYSVDKTALAQNQVVAKTGETAHTLVSSGQSWLDQHIVIANPETRTPCQPDQLGEIWIAGPNVAQGYWQRPEPTQETFEAYLADTGEGPFLRTGDLGFIKDGQLFVTGRLKDVIIIRGQNHYPQDIELTVEESHPSLQAGGGAVFTIEEAGEERLVIVHEVTRTHLRQFDATQLFDHIRRAVSEAHELQVYAIALLKPATISKTSSGKIQRYACREKFLNDQLETLALDNPQTRIKDQKSLSYGENDMTTNHQHQIRPPEISVDQSRVRADTLITWLREYANTRINSRLIDERRCIPPYIVLDFGNQGLLGLQVPEQYGGLGLTLFDALRVFEQLAAIDLTLTTFVGVHHALGTRPILKYAKPDVQDKYLPLLAEGRQLSAFALTEPGAGSNPRAISTTAVPAGDGQWLLRGQKVWIGSGSWAGVINVFAQLMDSNRQPLGITGFVVPQGAKGLTQGPEALTMGMRGVVQNSLYFNDVLVGSDSLLGEVGQGMAVAQDAMMLSRLGFGMMSVGAMKRCAQLMLRYAERRSVSTGRLLDNPVTLARLNDLTAAIVTIETLTTKLVRLFDQGQTVPNEACMACKILGPEFLYQSADHLVQLLGGRGYIETNIAPQLLRDARLLRIFEGPTETLTIFLGSSVVNNRAAIRQLLEKQMGAASVAEKWAAAIDQVTERYRGGKIRLVDHNTAIRWTHFLLGEITAFALLWAAVQESHNHRASQELGQAVEWAKQRFEQKLLQALTYTPPSAMLAGAQIVSDVITGYTETIGLLEQTLAGEDHTLDGLLSINPSGPAEVKPAVQDGSIAAEQPPLGQSHSHLAETIENWLIDWLSKELRVSPSSISPEKAFAEYGLDSLMAIELADDLENWLTPAGTSIETTLPWHYPTIETLAHFLANELIGLENPPSDPVNPKNLDRSSDEDLSGLSEAELVNMLASELSLTKQKP
ncbi:MAG: AMP-binding protein [Anaerolineae bacterium]|nr:AMP-binding protein [Anaerolineae bacterium]